MIKHGKFIFTPNWYFFWTLFYLYTADQIIDGATITTQDYFERIVPLKTPIGVISTAMLELSFVRDPQRHLEANNHQELVR